MAENGTDYLIRSVCVLLIFTSVGFLLVVNGYYTGQRYADLDAAADFTKGTCTVTAVQHSARSGTAGSEFQCVGSNCPQSCDDYYVYFLDATSLGVLEAPQHSEPEVVERSADQLCPSSTPQQPSVLGLEARDNVPCWAATDPTAIPRHNSGADGMQPSEGYVCGSLRCVKINDPATEASALQSAGSGLVVGGIFAMVLGLALIAMGAKSALFEPVQCKNDRFTKTGLGRT